MSSRGDKAFTGVQEIIEAGMGQSVQGCSPVGSRCDQPRFFKQCQMRRDCRLRKAEVSRKLTDPMRAVGKTVDQRQPGRLGQCPEDAGYILVLVHLIIDRHITFISLTSD